MGVLFKKMLASVRQDWYYGLFIKRTKPDDHNKYPLPQYTSIGAIAVALDIGRQYKPDGLIDKINHPRLTQKRIKTQAKIGDCEDHAIYWAVALLKSGLATEASLLNVQYHKGIGKSKSKGAHVVCLFRSAQDGKLYWVDYNEPHEVTRESHAAYQIGDRIYGTGTIAATVTPIKYIQQDDTPLFSRSYRVV